MVLIKIFRVSGRVSDPGELHPDPDPTIEKKPDLDLTPETKPDSVGFYPDPDPTHKKTRIRILTHFFLIKLNFFFFLST